MALRSTENDLSSVAELVKETMEKWSKEAGELGGAIENRVNQIVSEYKDKLEKEMSARKEVEKESSDLKDELQSCQTELENLKRENELQQSLTASGLSEKSVENTSLLDDILSTLNSLIELKSVEDHLRDLEKFEELTVADLNQKLHELVKLLCKLVDIYKENVQVLYQANKCLSTLCKAVGPHVVFGKMFKITKQHNNKDERIRSLAFLLSALDDFGISNIELELNGSSDIQLKDIFDFCKNSLHHVEAENAGNGVKLFVVLHKLVGLAHHEDLKDIPLNVRAEAFKNLKDFAAEMEDKLVLKPLASITARYFLKEESSNVKAAASECFSVILKRVGVEVYQVFKEDIKHLPFWYYLPLMQPTRERDIETMKAKIWQEMKVLGVYTAKKKLDEKLTHENEASAKKAKNEQELLKRNAILIEDNRGDDFPFLLFTQLPWEGTLYVHKKVSIEWVQQYKLKHPNANLRLSFLYTYERVEAEKKRKAEEKRQQEEKDEEFNKKSMAEKFDIYKKQEKEMG